MVNNRNNYIFQSYLKNIAHNIKKFQDSYLSPYGITNQQARIVSFIDMNQKDGKKTCQKDIETLIGVKGSSVTSLLHGLEKNGFILRNVDSSDNRIKELSLTPKGQILINCFDKVFSETEERITYGMTEDQKDIFLKLLEYSAQNII